MDEARARTNRKRPAFLLLAKLAPLTSHPLFLKELRQRALAPLLVTDMLPSGAGGPSELGRQNPVLAGLEDVAVLDGAHHLPILQRVAAWAEEYAIRGTLCLGEVFVEAGGLAADLLGLRHAGVRAARVCRNKHLQRLYLQPWSPASRLITPQMRVTSTGSARADFAADFSAGPAILKPVARFASSGVQQVADAHELRRRFEDYAPDEMLLLETKVIGREISVEALVQDGDVVFSGITQKSTNESEGRHFVETAHTIPGGNLSSTEVAAVLAANNQVLCRLGFEHGVAHAEYRVTADGVPYLMEIACRAPGDGILALYHLATLHSLEAELIKCALGEPVAYPQPVRYARQVYLPHPTGRLMDVRVANLPGVAPYWVPCHGRWPDIEAGSAGDPARLRQLLVLKERGAALCELHDSFDRAVTFLIDAPTAEALDGLEGHVRQSVSIVTG